MRVFVTGATGVIGRRAVPLLVAAGHRVTAMGRTPEKRAQLAALGAETTGVGLFEGRALRSALTGHDVVVNLATHIPETTTRMLLPWAWKENDVIRREGSAILSRAAIEAGVGRFIQESFAPVYPDRGAEWIEETTPLATIGYNHTIRDAERSAERFTAGGGAGVVLRFGGFYGPDGFSPGDMLDVVRKGWSPLPGARDAYLSSISHDDAATAVVAALGLPAGTYNVSDDEPLSRWEYVGALAALAGVRHPGVMPGWAALLTGPIGRLLARSVRMSNGKLRRAAPEWRPRYPSAREGLRAAVTPTASPPPAAAPHPAAAHARR